MRLVAFRSALAGYAHAANISDSKFCSPELKKGRNIELYTQTVSEASELLGEALGHEWGLDKNWCDSKRREYNEREIALDNKLSEHRREEDTNEEILVAHGQKSKMSRL